MNNLGAWAMRFLSEQSFGDPAGFIGILLAEADLHVWSNILVDSLLNISVLFIFLGIACAILAAISKFWVLQSQQGEN